MNMKLSRIAIHEPSVKHSFTLKQSTTDLLERYRKEYSKLAGTDVKLKDLVEQMLLDFMAEDKTFQKVLRSAPEPEAKSRQAAPAPTAATAGSAVQDQGSNPAI